MRTHRHLVCALPALAFVLLTTPALAEPGGEWTIAPYVWIAGFEGTVGSSGGNDNTGNDADFGHLWDNLALAGAMVNVNWRRERWSALGDWTYANLRSDSPSSVPALYDSTESQLKGHVIQAYVGYDLRPREDSHFDVIGGARYYNLDVSIDFAGAALPSTQLHGSEGWIDAVGGVRWTQEFAGHWRSYLQGDVGTGGSNFSWQIYAGAGYDFSWGSLFGGWRYLHIDYGSGSYQLDAALTGPFLGAAWTF